MRRSTVAVASCVTLSGGRPSSNHPTPSRLSRLEPRHRIFIPTTQPFRINCIDFLLPSPSPHRRLLDRPSPNPFRISYRTTTPNRNRHHVQQTNGPRHASRVPSPLPSQAGPPRGPKGRQGRRPAQEADPGPPQEGRHAEGLPEGEGAPRQAGHGRAHGRDRRHGGAQRLADPGQQRHEPDDAHDGSVDTGHERCAEECEPGEGEANLSFLLSCHLLEWGSANTVVFCRRSLRWSSTSSRTRSTP